MRSRSGTTLVELLAGMAVGSLVVVAAIGGQLHLRRIAEGIVVRGQGERRGSELIAVVEAVGRQLRHARVVGDTALEAELRIGVGVTCRADTSGLRLTPSDPSDADALTVLAEVPANGDRLDYLASPDTARGPEWISVQVREALMMTGRDACGDGSPFVGASSRFDAAARLTFALPVPVPPPGAPVELYRRIRLVTYQEAGGAWMVGLRNCAGMRCGAAQPIGGPVRPPREGGLAFHAAADGYLTAIARIPAVDRPFSGIIVVGRP